MEVDRKRSIVEAIFEKIEIGEQDGKGKIKISYSGLPSSEELCKSQQQMGQPLGIFNFTGAREQLQRWIGREKGGVRWKFFTAFRGGLRGRG